MRDENRKLQVEIGVLTSQIDLANNGQSKYENICMVLIF